jgi:hypothetical protein
MLALNSPRWATLEVRSGSAVGVPSEITSLLESSGFEDHGWDQVKDRLWRLLSELRSEDTVWSAAFAAAPYLLEIARKLPACHRSDCLVTLASMVLHGDPRDVPDGLMLAYGRSVSQALPLLLETVQVTSSALDLRWQLMALAALKGHPSMAKWLASPETTLACWEVENDGALTDVFEAMGLANHPDLER